MMRVGRLYNLTRIQVLRGGNKAFTISLRLESIVPTDVSLVCPVIEICQNRAHAAPYFSQLILTAPDDQFRFIGTDESTMQPCPQPAWAKLP